MKEVIRKFVPLSTRLLYHRAKRRLEKRMRRAVEDEAVRFDIESLYKGTFEVTYRGISALRCPFDYVMYQMIVSELEPNLIIEIGTNRGGTALYFADLMNTFGSGMVHTIDIEDRCPEMVHNHPRIKLFKNGWDGYSLEEAVPFSKILVIDDASHMYEDAIGALEKFAPLVSRGSYFILEDGIIDELGMSEQYHGGPLRAIREFLVKNKDFEVDKKYCDMFGKNATFNVNGYLKRK